MSKTLPKGPKGYSPLITNASVNRDRAVEAFKGGLTAEEIAAEWPMVWKIKDGKISQRYDYELADGSGRFETNRTITQESVRAAIARKVAAK